MKKFVLVLIVCTLLCASLCLLLVGCDSSDAEAKAPNSGETKIEFIKKSRSSSDSNVVCTFRVWYPLEWFAKDYRGPQIGYKTADDDELKYASYSAEFLAESYNSKYQYSKVPDSWLYFDIYVAPSTKSIYIEVACEVYVTKKIMAYATFALA